MHLNLTWLGSHCHFPSLIWKCLMTMLIRLIMRTPSTPQPHPHLNHLREMAVRVTLPRRPLGLDLLTWGFFFICSLMEEESRLVNSPQQLGIKGISSAREKAHCSAKEFPEKKTSATSFGNLVHVSQLSTRSYGAANKCLGKGLCIALFWLWEPVQFCMCFKSAGCALLGGETAFLRNLPNWEREGQRHTWFYLWLYLEQASKPGASRNPACNRVLCGWYCILLNLDLNAFVSFGGVHEVMKSPVPSGPSLPVAYTIRLCIQSVSKYNQAPSKVMLCTLLGIWETTESKIFFLIPYCFGGYVVRIYNSQ